MGNFISLDEPMGPGFLIFFKSRKKSNDLINIRPPEWLYEKVEHSIKDISTIKEIRKITKKTIRNVEQVKKTVKILSKSRRTPAEIKKLIDSRDVVIEVSTPKPDSEYILTILFQWCLTINLRDDEEAILTLMLY